MKTKSFNASQRMYAVQTPIIPIVANLIKESPGTISLGQGVVYYPPPQSVLDKVRQMDSSLDYHLYSEVEGIAELRSRLLLKLEQENNIHLEGSERIVVTAGANMAS